MSIKDDLKETKEEIQELKEQSNQLNMYSNFDLGNTFKKIIYFLLILIIVLVGTIIFFIIKNNQMAKDLSEYTCESDIMEQDGIYNFIDSEGNMITTDADVLNKFIEEYYNGKTKKSN
jgi:hypothetical protein